MALWTAASHRRFDRLNIFPLTVPIPRDCLNSESSGGGMPNTDDLGDAGTRQKEAPGRMPAPVARASCPEPLFKQPKVLSEQHWAGLPLAYT